MGMNNPEATVQTNMLPSRKLARVVLVLICLASLYTAIGFLLLRSHIPLWFIPCFLLMIGFMVASASAYWRMLAEVSVHDRAVGKNEEALLWALMLLSIPCSSALHQFAPFSIFLYPELLSNLSELWRQIPPILLLNFFLTVIFLVLIIVLRVVYLLGGRRVAVKGLILLAAIMIIPNDNCSNDFNQPWLQVIGASPIMFVPNSLLLLIGSCGLCGIKPRPGIIIMAIINGVILLIGLGHITRLIW
jgi:hypothetical protein